MAAVAALSWYFAKKKPSLGFPKVSMPKLGNSRIVTRE